MVSRSLLMPAAANTDDVPSLPTRRSSYLGAAAADAGNEQPNKRSPGNGPAKNKEGPVSYPVTGGVGLQIKGTLNNIDRKSTRMNYSHVANSYAGYCLKNTSHGCRRSGNIV